MSSVNPSVILYKNRVIGGAGGGSDVAFTQILTSGTKIGTITIDGTTYDMYAPAGGSGGSSVEYNQIIHTGTKIGTITIDGTPTDIYAPAGGSGSTVSFSRTLSSGTKIGTITIDGTATDIYAPTGGGISTKAEARDVLNLALGTNIDTSLPDSQYRQEVAAALGLYVRLLSVDGYGLPSDLPIGTE